jgi:hypothetical protein
MIDSGAGTVKIGQETFAVGLFWQAAPSVPAAIREARIVAVQTEIAADLFAVRRLGQPQFGLGTTRAEHKPKMPSLAAVLANALAEASWAGVFETEDGWVYVAVRKGAIMPDGDALYRSEDEARNRLREDLSVGGWEAVFAPPGWMITDARDESLEDLCGRTRDGRLMPVATSRLRPLLVAGAIVGGGLAVWLIVVPGQEAPPAPAVPDVPVAPPPPPPPWQGKPAGMDVVEACQNAMAGARVLPGFDLVSADCTGQRVVFRYTRSVGTVAWLPDGTGISSPNEAVDSRPLTVPARPDDDAEQPWPAHTVRELLWASAQTYRLDLSLGGDVPAKTILPMRAPELTQTFNALPVTLASPLPPTVFAALLAGVPTWVVDQVSWKPKGWIVKGNIYVR